MVVVAAVVGKRERYGSGIPGTPIHISGLWRVVHKHRWSNRYGHGASGGQPLPVTDHGVMLFEVAMTTEIDGKPGTGWCEFQWDDTYLAHMKKYKHIRR